MALLAARRAICSQSLSEVMSMMRYVVKFRVYMALLAEGETCPVAFYKYDPPGGGRKDRSGGRKDRSVRAEVSLLINQEEELMPLNSCIQFHSTFTLAVLSLWS
jgi:hypothetical protein